MSLQTRLIALAQAIAGDIKALNEVAMLKPVDVASTGNVDIASAPVSTAFDGTSSASWLTGRILLHKQTNLNENGVWLYNGQGAPMTRADLRSKVGQTVYVRLGTTYGGKLFVSTRNAGVGEQWGFEPLGGSSTASPTLYGTRTARPATASEGQRYFATDTLVEYIFLAGAWARVSEPAGKLLHWPGLAIPAGFALMNGTTFTDAIGQEIWHDLHALAAVEFDAGRTGFFHRVGLSGVNSWPVDRRLKLKDLRGRTLMGSGQPLNDSGVGNLAGMSNRVLGAALGAESVALSVAEMPPHDHPVSGPNAVTGFMAIRSDPANQGLAGGGTGSWGSYGTIGSRGGGAAHENTQPSTPTNIIIRL